MSTIYNSSKTAETVNRSIDNNMGTTTTEQGASSAGLIISEDLQPIVQCVQGFDYSISEKTVTRVPPLTFHAIAQHLIDWSIDGNTDGGNSVGARTGNLLDYSTVESTSNATATPISGGITISGRYYVQFKTVEFVVGRSYTMSWIAKTISGTVEVVWRFRYSDDTYSLTPSSGGSLIAEKEVYALLLYVNGSSTESGVVELTNIMLNAGSTALPYKPYGYDVPIKVNNTDTYHCYITDVLRKSDGETPVYDTMSSDGTIIRRVDTDGTPLDDPTTETYTAPDITVNWGWNTIDVDTTVTPSSMTINYKDD